jgi:hypothetical protein
VASKRKSLKFDSFLQSEQRSTVTLWHHGQAGVAARAVSDPECDTGWFVHVRLSVFVQWKFVQSELLLDSPTLTRIIPRAHPTVLIRSFSTPGQETENDFNLHRSADCSTAGNVCAHVYKKRYRGPERHSLSLVEQLRKVTRFQPFSGAIITKWQFINTVPTYYVNFKTYPINYEIQFQVSNITAMDRMKFGISQF